MRDLLLLIFLQACWSASYVAMKISLGAMPLGLVMILRYGIATLALLLCGGWRGQKFTRRDALLLCAVGFLDFTLSPLFQLSALQLTFAGDTALLIAMEPLLTAMLAWPLLGERINRRTLIAFSCATIGALVMSDAASFFQGHVTSLRLFGNGIFLLALICEALFSITSRSLTQRYSPLATTTRMFAVGTLGNIFWYHHDFNSAALTHITPHGWFAILFLAIPCSALGYGAWAFLARRMKINRLSLSLFLQPLFGQIVAAIVLGERPTIMTLLGGGIIFVSLLVWTILPGNAKNSLASPV